MKKVQREGLLERKGKVIPCTGTVEKACEPSHNIITHTHKTTTTTTKTINVTVGMKKNALIMLFMFIFKVLLQWNYKV